MHKDCYIVDPDVDAFSLWLAEHLYDETFEHEIFLRKAKKAQRFASLFDAYLKYEWPFSAIEGVPHPPVNYDFCANSLVLNHLSEKLRTALDSEATNHSDIKNAAIDVMTWGGVRNRNVDWLGENKDNLKHIIKDVRSAINSQDTAKLPQTGLRFNSGMTKIYSLVGENFVIYDSRVAAALGRAVAKFCIDSDRTEVPETLAFPWAPAKEAPRHATPKCRDPRKLQLDFPRLRPGIFHAEWNMKASWLLQNVVEKSAPNQQLNSLSQPLRALEAALFMHGYDLNRWHPCSRSITAD